MLVIFNSTHSLNENQSTCVILYPYTFTQWAGEKK